MPNKSSKVFLSYAHSDRDTVQKIAGHLRHAGLDLWDPAEQILPGSDFTTDLKSALDSADAMVIFISPEAMASREVSREIEYALGAKHLSRRLIPVVIRPTKDAPWILDSVESVRYQGPGRTSQQIVELLRQSQDAPPAKSRAL